MNNTEGSHVFLEVSNLNAGYGPAMIVSNVSFSITKGEVVGLLGRNGMGKTTTIRSILNQTPWKNGSVKIESVEVGGLPTYKIARMGMGLVPEGRRIFPTLTVTESLEAFYYTQNLEPRWTPDEVFRIFPELESRKNLLTAYLSGGEQQMLSIGRALVTNPRLLILDEATEGLSEQVRKRIWQCLRELRNDGLTILLVDKNISELLELTDYNLILEKGALVWHGRTDDLEKSPEIIDRFLYL